MGLGVWQATQAAASINPCPCRQQSPNPTNLSQAQPRQMVAHQAGRQYPRGARVMTVLRLLQTRVVEYVRVCGSPWRLTLRWGG
jgi:hypothetical protein